MFTSTQPQTSELRAAPAPADGYRGPERRRRVAAAFDPIYVGRFVWRWRWFAVGTAVIGLVCGGLVAAATPKTYIAGTQILLDPRDLKVVQNEVAPNALPSDATLALIESQTAVVTSDRVIAEVIRRADLVDDPEFNGRQATGVMALLPARLAALFKSAPSTSVAELHGRVAEKLQRGLSVSREPKSFIISLRVTTEDATKSARLANLFAETFIGEMGRIQSDTARRATTALSSRLSELRQAVVEAEGKVEDYKAQNALIGVNGKLVDDDYLTRTNDALARARTDIAALRAKAESLRDAKVDDVVRGTLPEELSSEALVRLRQTYADLAGQVASLSTRLGPRHPQLVAVEAARADAREAIARELSRIVAAGQTELTRALATERDLASQIDALKAKQVTTSEAFVKLRELEREVDASRAVYEAFLLRTRETSQQESLNTANVRVLSEANPPLRPAGPARKLMLVAGGIVGLGLGVGLLAAIAMGRLLAGFLRQDRRGGDDRTIWTAAEREAHRRAAQAPPAAAIAGEGTVAPPADPSSDPDRRIWTPAEREAYRRSMQPDAAPAAETAPVPLPAAAPAPVAAPLQTAAVARPRAVPAFLTRGAEPEAPATVAPSTPRDTDIETKPDGAPPEPAAAPREIEAPAAPAPTMAKPDAERAALRERMRVLAREGNEAAMRLPEIGLIENELRSVRAALTEIRQNRAGRA